MEYVVEGGGGVVGGETVGSSPSSTIFWSAKKGFNAFKINEMTSRS